MSLGDSSISASCNATYDVYSKYMREPPRLTPSFHANSNRRAIDDNVGRILDWLDNEGLAENTLICYTSDQGYFLGEHGWYDKRFLYEESFQMPFLARGPGIPAGTVCDHIVQNVDFAPTFLELDGLPIPRHYQGDSFLASLRGTAPPQSPDQVAYHRYWMHKDGNNNAYAHYGIRDKRWKLIFWYNMGYNIPGANRGGEDQEWELFDCENDPMELFNLWEEKESRGRLSAPPLDEVRERMIRLLEAKMAEMAEIGDVPAHPLGLSEAQLREKYQGSVGAAKLTQSNM